MSPSPQAPEANPLPTLTIALREDGGLCLVLPGLANANRQPLVADEVLTAGFIRRLLESQRDARERRIGARAEPVQSQLEHAGHRSPRRGCAECDAARLRDSVDRLIGEGRVRRPSTHAIAKNGEIEIRQRVGWHYCECGFAGEFKPFAAHLSSKSHLKSGHGEISAARARAARWAEAPEWKGLYDSASKEEVEL